jgi:hypothetical protein
MSRQRSGSAQTTFTKETERDRPSTWGWEREGWRRLMGWEGRATENMSRQREDTCRQHSESAQTAVRKGVETDTLRTCSSRLTTIERLRAMERGARGWEAERGAGKQLPSACDQPAASTSKMRTEGTSWLHLLACYPARPLTHTEARKKVPLESGAGSCVSLMTYLLCLMSYIWCLMSYSYDTSLMS